MIKWQKIDGYLSVLLKVLVEGESGEKSQRVLTTWKTWQSSAQWNANKLAGEQEIISKYQFIFHREVHHTQHLFANRRNPRQYNIIHLKLPLLTARFRNMIYCSAGGTPFGSQRKFIFMQRSAATKTEIPFVEEELLNCNSDQLAKNLIALTCDSSWGGWLYLAESFTVIKHSSTLGIFLASNILAINLQTN